MVRDRLAGIALVLADAVMPMMGGRKLVTRLRAIRPDIKVVFTSGYASDPETAQHARNLGTGFILKPFVPSALRHTVRLCLQDGPAFRRSDPARVFWLIYRLTIINLTIFDK